MVTRSSFPLGTPAPDRRRRVVVGLLFLIATVNNLDRQVLSVLAPALRRELGFGVVEYSDIVAAFLAAYTAGYVFSGLLLDRWGARFGLAAGLAAWSLAGMAHAFVTGWVGLMACRFLLGLAESCNSPGGLKAIAEWIPPRERALATAIFSNGNVMGAVLAPPLVAGLALWLGWRWAFVVSGASGLLLAAVWMRFYRPGTGMGWRRVAATDAPPPIPRRAYAQLWRNPSCLAFCCGRFLTDATNYFFAFWLPDYLLHGRGFTLALFGLLGWLPFLAADVGGLGGGWWSDALVRRGWSPVWARLGLMGCAALAMPLTMLVVRVGSAGLALGIMGLVLAAQSCWMANQLTLVAESAPRHAVATLVAISAMAGGVGGILANLVAGRAIAAHGYFPVFSVVGWAHLAAWLVLAAVLRRQGARGGIHGRPVGGSCEGPAATGI